MIKLFQDILSGEWFHFGDKPWRKLLKSNHSHYISNEGRRQAHPHVAVFPDKMEGNPRKSIYDQTEGDSNE